jgi:ribosomal protein S21
MSSKEVLEHEVDEAIRKFIKSQKKRQKLDARGYYTIIDGPRIVSLTTSDLLSGQA